MAPSPTPSPSPAPIPEFCTAINASIGHPSWRAGLATAAALGVTQVELWWPFPTPEPDPADIDALCTSLADANVALVALNLWGGDLAAGDRGVLHHTELSSGHLDAVAQITERTGVPRYNLLLGRAGRTLTATQRHHLDRACAQLSARGLGLPLIEPLSGLEDYPVTTMEEAFSLTADAPRLGVLADFFHLEVVRPGSGQDYVDAVNAGTLPLPDHVQVAGYPDRRRPRGEDLTRLATLCAHLRREGYRGEVVAEYLPDAG